MIRSRLIYLLPLVILLGALLPAHADSLFTDSTFAVGTYSVGASFISGTGTAGINSCSTCGNPGAGLQVLVDLVTPGTIGIALLFNNFTYDPQTQGAINSISASVDKNITANTAAGNTFHPTIEQDGNFYIASIAGPGVASPSGGTTGYNTLAQAGLLATDFVGYDFTTGVTGTNNPNFSGDPIVFGLSQITSNALSGAMLEADFDNLSLNISSAAVPVPTPEPSSMILLAVGLAGMLLISRRKLAFNN